MYSLKLAHLLKEHTDAEVYNFYIDIRAAGKSYEEFYDKLLDENVHFIRGRVAEVSDWAVRPSEEGKLIIRAEDTLIGIVRRVPVDMVVLAVGMEPQADSQDVRRCLISHAPQKDSSLNDIPNLLRWIHLQTASLLREHVRDRKIYLIALRKPVLLQHKRSSSSTAEKLNLNRTQHMLFRRNARAAELV